MLTFPERAKTYCLWIALSLAAASAFYLSALALRTPINGDEGLFMGVGRGILNGLAPWRDLFETKPPIIFWISALSLWLGGNDTSYKLLLVSGLACMTSLLWSLAPQGRKQLAIVIGLSLSAYILFDASGFETEAFGAFPAALAIFAFLKRRANWEMIAAICFSVLSLLKEPFLPTLVVSFALLAESRKDFLSIGRIVLIGGVTSLLVLLFSGTFHDYFTVYLPEMFGTRNMPTMLYHDFGAQTEYLIPSSGALRGIFFQELVGNFAGVSFGMGIALVSMLCVFLDPTVRNRRWILGSIALIVVIGFAGNTAYTLQQIASYLHHVPWEDSFFRWKTLEVVALGGAAIALLGLMWLKTEKLIRPTLLVLLSLYVVNYAAGVGGFSPVHFLFAIPVWIALGIVFLRAMVPVVGVLLLVLGMSFSNAAYIARAQAHSTPRFVVAAGLQGQQARLVDRVLTDCKADRYMIIDGNMFYLQGLTMHSPFQLFYGVTRAYPIPVGGVPQTPNPYLEALLENDWQETKIAVASPNPDWIFRYEEPAVDEALVEGVPPCAAQDLSGNRLGVRFFFDKEWQ